MYYEEQRHAGLKIKFLENHDLSSLIEREVKFPDAICRKGWSSVTPILAETKCICLYNNVKLEFNGSSESQLFSFESQQILMDAGVHNVSQMTDHPVIPSQYLPMQAALCVREGLDNLRALQSITINPARILGIEDKVGSLEEDKDADIVIWNGDQLDSRSKPIMTIINGQVMFKLNNEKY